MVVTAPRGRARQMNAGAQKASGDVLLFLHADTRLPEHADKKIVSELLTKRNQWGRFDVRLSGNAFLLRVIEWLMNWRSRLTGIATGDQAIFVRRDTFYSIGQYPDIDLMEDIELSRLLKQRGKPLCLSQCVVTSSRRWEHRGILRTILLMWRMRLAYFFGIDPQRLARDYQRL